METSDTTRPVSTLTGNGQGTLVFPKTTQEALKSASDLAERATEWAKKNPIPAVVIGAFAGYIFGSFARRVVRGK